MKATRKLLCLLLILTLAVSMIPMGASARDINDVTASNPNRYTWYYLEDGTYFIVDNTTGLIVNSTNMGAPTSAQHRHNHAFGFDINRDGHFYSCSCGVRGIVIPHIDPQYAVDGCCTCGYRFMDNADLTVLWLSGMVLSPRFTKDKTEYEGKLYKGVTETKISARSFDAKATIELPEDLTVKDGTKLEIKVTAEDGKTTKTYVVNIVE